MLSRYISVTNILKAVARSSAQPLIPGMRSDIHVGTPKRSGGNPDHSRGLIDSTNRRAARRGRPTVRGGVGDLRPTGLRHKKWAAPRDRGTARGTSLPPLVRGGRAGC